MRALGGSAQAGNGMRSIFRLLRRWSHDFGAEPALRQRCDGQLPAGPSCRLLGTG